MEAVQTAWALVLAGGDGKRLAALTRDGLGNQVPKQFCSLSGGPALVQDALQRARQVAPRERTCVIVAEQHERYWKEQLQELGPHNVIRQPRNCGTAVGIALAVLHIARRDPLARIVFLPADHHVRDEAALGGSLCEAVALITDSSGDLVLVGIEPEGVDPDLGYVVPGALRENGGRAVEKFVEKPDPSLARQLLASGAVWNSFIFAATATTLLKLLRHCMPGVVAEMSHALASDARRAGGPAIRAVANCNQAIRDLYERLPSVDFSKAVLQRAQSQLRLITAPACGWTDLGTPGRVAAAVNRLDCSATRQAVPRPGSIPGFLNLAERSGYMRAPQLVQQGAQQGAS